MPSHTVDVSGKKCHRASINNLICNHELFIYLFIFLEIAYAHTPALMAPIIPPAFMTNISNGQFVGGLNNVMTGLSIFCIHPANVPNWQQLNE